MALLRSLRNWLRGSIRRQLVIGIALVHAVLMTIFVFDLVNRQHDFLHQQSLDEARALAQTLAANSVSWVLASDVSGLQEVVFAQKGYPQLEYAMILDTNGRVLGHVDETRLGLYVSDEVSRKLLQAPPAFTVLVDSPALVDVAVPVFTGVEQVGWARIGLEESVLLSQLQQVTHDGLIYTVGAILIGILFAILLSRGMIAGLNDLLRVASTIRAGGRGQRVQHQRQDEIGELASTFNLMLDTIDEEARQKHQNEACLIRAEARIRLLLESTAEGIIGFDEKACCTFANPAGIRALGYTRAEELLERPLTTLLWGEQSEAAHLPERAFNNGESVHCAESSFICRDGSAIYAEYWLSPIHDQGQRLGAVLTFIDITRRKQAEQELSRYRDELEQRVEARTAELSALNRELEAFSYSVSHDLRAPLRSIHGFSKIIASKYHDKLDASGQDYLERVMRASNRMSALIDDLLVLSRINRKEMRLETVDMTALAEQVMGELREGEAQGPLQFQLEPLPSVCADRKLLALVLQNLLGNALKFSAREATPTIRVSGQRRGGQLHYTVSDNGVGFDMAFADKLFGAFQRLHNSDEFEGTGIGLATVQRIIHRHGGRIWAEAEPGRGARFHFTLPDQQCTEDEP
ncbi:MAG: ATP-binding protein [Pseudomonadota bacterium]